MKCVDCSGPHKANSGDCAFIMNAQEIQLLKSQGLSYREAEKTVQMRNPREGSKQVKKNERLTNDNGIRKYT